MDDYEIVFTRSARKELEALDAVLVRRIFSKIERLATNPRPSGSTKLVGEEYLWRIRIGDYRVIYSIDDPGREVNIIVVRHRREAYN
ncbi:MAG: type II toxin-antitoxin system RelE/ParE family toxin [Acidobacteriota bacterium]